MKELRSFLGLVGYYRKFILNFLDVSAPLTDLTRKCSPKFLNLKEVHLEAFGKLKNIMINPPILKLPHVGSSLFYKVMS